MPMSDQRPYRHAPFAYPRDGDYQEEFVAGMSALVGPECILICVNDLTRPHSCGNHPIAPVVDCCLTCGRISRAKRPFFPSKTLEWQWSGGFDPEIPILNGTRRGM